MFSLRTKIEGFLIIILGIVIILAHTYYKKYLEQKSEKENVEQLFSKKQAEIELYKNNHGQIVAKNEGLEFENKTIKDLVKQGNLQFLKEFDGLKKNLRYLEYAYQIQAKLVDSLHVKLDKKEIEYITSKGDTIKFIGYNWDYKDKWTEIEVRQISPDSANFKYKMDIELDGVMYWHKKWFLGKKHWEAEATSNNPNVKINKLLNIKIKKR